LIYLHGLPGVTRGNEGQTPLVESVKDQHLLKPPPSMESTTGFGRRASDGGANLQQKEKPPATVCEGGWSHPSSREQLSTVRSIDFNYHRRNLALLLYFSGGSSTRRHVRHDSRRRCTFPRKKS